ncbi:SCO family protein [Flavobacteriaceae bacterium F08102]|nr:SCO family protein [Flavobacteriaceae bacterium F08102]
MNYKTKLYRISRVGARYFGIALLLSCAGKTASENQSRVETLPYYKDASFTPHWISENNKSMLENFHRIPAFRFINQEGQEITQETLTNKIYVADFFFTSCPGICPQMTSNMHLIQEAFKTDDSVLLLSHSVTPEMDSVAILKKYAKEKGINASKWHLLTGDRSDIYTLGRSFYFVEEDLGETKTEADFLHTENFILVDKNKHIRGIYNGLNKTAVNQLIADIKTLQKEG